MNIAFLFPGQGSQTVGMGKDIYKNYDEVKEIYKKVEELTNIPISKLSFEGPEEILNETKNTQLAILTMSLAILEVLKNNNINAKTSAGLSLGEYSALIYSGALDFKEGIKLVQKRGEYMQNYLPQGDWKMAAILGLEDEQVEEVCKKVTKGFVVPANYNCKGQVAISGEEEAILEAEKIAKEMGAKKVRILNTAGPFHTEKLTKSSELLQKELKNINIHNFNIEVIKNIDGTPYSKTDNVKEILAKHIISPVRFSKTIENMLKQGIDTFVEIGPGKTLSGFVKRSDGFNSNINILTINNLESLQNAINFLKKEGK